MNTHLNRMLFSRAFVKVSACVVLSAGCLPMAAYAESVEAPVVESVLQQKAISGKVVDSKGESNYWCEYYGKRHYEWYNYRF